MVTERKQEIKKRAKEINKISEQFQLVHATFATQNYIKQCVQEFYQEKIKELAVRIAQKAAKDLPTDEELVEKAELEEQIKRNHFSIDIGYIDVPDEEVARVVKLDNFFAIYLSSSLKNAIFKENGDYNYETIGKIRKLMSHELGHLVLHTKDLLLENSLQGTLQIQDVDREDEADLFGHEFLELRKERNKKIRDDGGADILF